MSICRSTLASPHPRHPPPIPTATIVSINPFFYGTYLAATKTEEPIARSEKESYQCDAISSMTTINETYFKVRACMFEKNALSLPSLAALWCLVVPCGVLSAVDGAVSAAASLSSC